MSSTQVQTVTARNVRTFLEKADPTLIPAGQNLLRLAKSSKKELEEVIADLEQWLTENMSEPVSETVVEAMMKSYHRMWKTRPSPFDRHQFYVNWQEPGLLFTRVPMATLNSDRDGFKLGRGYDMSTNNSDLPHQQLSLLVGLAKIEELATGAYFRKVPQAI